MLVDSECSQQGVKAFHNSRPVKIAELRLPPFRPCPRSSLSSSLRSFSFSLRSFCFLGPRGGTPVGFSGGATSGSLPSCHTCRPSRPPCGSSSTAPCSSSSMAPCSSSSTAPCSSSSLWRTVILIWNYTNDETSHHTCATHASEICTLHTIVL